MKTLIIIAASLALFVNARIAISDTGGEIPSMIEGLPILAMDINGDGLINTKPIRGAGATFFDVDNDDFSELTGWVTAEDGILAIDLNNNSLIDNAHELLADADIAGFAKLQRDLDNNHDGMINRDDTAFNELLIWQDANQDGISQKGELLYLSDVGVTTIPTQAVKSNDTPTDAYTITETGTFNIGKTPHLIAAISFAADNVVAVQTHEYIHEIHIWSSPKVDGLRSAIPNLRGYGLVADLFIVAADNPDTFQVARAFSDMDRVEDVLDNNGELLASWSGFNRAHHRKSFSGDLTRLDKLWIINRFRGAQDNSVAETAEERQRWVVSDASNDFAVDYMFGCLANHHINRLLIRGPLHSGISAYYSTGSDTLIVTNQKSAEDTIVHYVNHHDDEFELTVFARMIPDLFTRVALDTQGMLDRITPTPFNHAIIGVLNGTLHTGRSKPCSPYRGTYKNDLRISNRENNFLDLGPGDDIAYGLSGDDTLIGGRGNDYLIGGKGNDTYIYFVGRDGMDTINENGSPDDINTLEITNVSRLNQPWFSRHGDDLRIEFLGVPDSQITLQGWFKKETQQLERINIATTYAAFTLVNDHSGNSPLDRFMTDMLLSEKPNSIESAPYFSMFRYRHAAITDGYFSERIAYAKNVISAFILIPSLILLIISMIILYSRRSP